MRCRFCLIAAVAVLFLLFWRRRSEAREGRSLEIEVMPVRGLERWAEAIQHCEGWYPGSRSYRNNNPGNLKFAGQEGAVGGDEEGYAVFVDFASGWKALVRQLEFAVSGRSRFYQPTMTLREFVHTYAPGSDPGYLVCIANRLGVSPEIEIRELAL